MRPVNLYVEGKNPSALKGCIEVMTKPPVTQTKRNTIVATAALTSPLDSYTHRICTIVKQLNAKIHSQTRQTKYIHMI